MDGLIGLPQKWGGSLRDEGMPKLCLAIQHMLVLEPPNRWRIDEARAEALGARGPRSTEVFGPSHPPSHTQGCYQLMCCAYI